MPQTDPKNALTKVSAGLWRFTSRLAGRQQPCHGYILPLEKEVWLVDPPADLEPKIIAENFDGRKVAQIFITHLQEEHAAGALHYPEAPVHAPEGDEYLCRGPEFYKKQITLWQEPWDWSTLGNYPGNLAGALNERPVAKPLNLGESLRAGTTFMGFELVATPGHGKHAVSLLRVIDGKKTAFCGDLIYAPGQVWNWFDCDWDYGAETGQRTLAASCRRLRETKPELLCPAHGEIMSSPETALELTEENIGAVLTSPQNPPAQAIDFPDNEIGKGWREIVPRIYQYKTGNNILVTSPSGNALVIDDGLCLWKPLDERRREHDEIFRDIKATLGIKRIEWIVPTHYHGDHTEFIPWLAEKESAQIICLDSISGPMEFPERYNLACPLPWYDSLSQKLVIDRKVPENFTLGWEGCRFRFFRLGGQTWYHLGLDAVIDGRRVLFVGDGFWGTLSSATPVLCWNEAEPADKGWVFALRRMLECRPEILVCGHGSALKNPLPCIEEALAAWDKRLADFAKLNPRATRDEFFSPFGAEHDKLS